MTWKLSNPPKAKPWYIKEIKHKRNIQAIAQTEQYKYRWKSKSRNTHGRRVIMKIETENKGIEIKDTYMQTSSYI